MPVVAVIQARMGSTRLPGKILLDLAGNPVLAWVVRAARAVPGVDRVIVATTTAASDDAVAAWASEAGARVFRGPEDDVLKRYALAAGAAGASTVMRITADCPLLDPEIAGRVLGLLGDGTHDYASNTDGDAWPDGLDCEAFTMSALLKADAEAKRPSEREHVTPYIRDPANGFSRVRLESPDASLSRERWTLDTPQDLAFLRAVAVALPKDRPPRYAEVLAAIERNPEVRQLNAGQSRNEGYQISLQQEAAARR